jgi:glycosyltransferase involved in cell wall biosynthesis
VKVAIAHDWMVQYAGSERCVEALVDLFPGSRLLTSVIDRDAVPRALRDAQASVLQRLPGAPHYHSWLLPLMPLAWRARRSIRDVDVVISSSHACAKAVRVDPAIPHVCYCHTPMRYAWDFASEQSRVSWQVRPLARATMAAFRRWDRATAARVTQFVANSRGVAERIRYAYDRSARVIHPPVRTEFFTPGVDRDDAFLFVGRLVSYKRADLVVEAFAGLPYRLVVVGTGHLGRELHARASANVQFIERCTDEELRALYRRSRALVYPADEDFGIVMAEAQACGTPVIGLGRGGALDIVEPGRTGVLIERQTTHELMRAVRRVAATDFDRSEIRRRAERFSLAAFQAGMLQVVDETVAAAGRR